MKIIRAVAAAFLLALALAWAPDGVRAQFTAAVVPPPAPPKVDTAATRDSARRAEAELVERMTAIKAWVDSAASALAAGAPAAPPIAPDSVAGVRPVPVPRDSTTVPPAARTRRREPGAPRPDSAIRGPLHASAGSAAAPSTVLAAARSLPAGATMRRR